MDPRLSIPPTRVVRRLNSSRWHIAADSNPVRSDTLCGTRIRFHVLSMQRKTAYNAQEIGCNDCIVHAISNRSIPSKGRR